jgi:lipopolysaccharide export system permease protein
LRNELFRVRTDFAASLIRLGEFTEPTKGLTVYAQDSDQSGALHNLFILQERPSGGDITFLAARGKVTKRNGAPVLVLREGSSQEFNAAGVLNYLKFDEYTFDLSSFLSKPGRLEYIVSDRYLHELLFPGAAHLRAGQTRTILLAEANARVASALYNIAFMALALAAVIGGPFSRLGYARRIAAVAVLATVVRIMGFVVQAASDLSVWLNILQYAIPIALAWWAFDQLFRGDMQAASARRTVRAVHPAGALA